jgi:NAD(P)H dehydrogenase (quinone)
VDAGEGVSAGPPPVRPRLLITGASGALGRLTAQELLAEHDTDGLILVSRTPEALGDVSEQRADVRYGDFAEPDSLPDAFAGAERMLLISASDVEVRAEQHRSAIRSAARAGVRHVVYTSGLNPEPPNPAVIAPSHFATERALAESGLSWTVLRNSLYAEYQVPEAAQALAAGELVHNRGDGRIAYVSRADCAAVAAAALATPRLDGRIYDVTGPESFSAQELAHLYQDVGGRQVKATALSDEAFVARLSGNAAAEDEHARYGARLVASLGRSIREGYMAAQADLGPALTSRPRRTLRSILESGLAG